MKKLIAVLAVVLLVGSTAGEARAQMETGLPDPFDTGPGSVLDDTGSDPFDSGYDDGFSADADYADGGAYGDATPAPIPENQQNGWTCSLGSASSTVSTMLVPVPFILIAAWALRRSTRKPRN